ncbi:hypothetical protein DPMN_159494 [Dreissena polymorpha]|uniref:Uncharacterized protein n=1 Tax=Dreissena polymorpha TaxID=45954 RepID=A0A9D4IP69_DREPO|nr:hypothetical protein DPMN_159494 [Dreissena polymorpha]
MEYQTALGYVAMLIRLLDIWHGILDCTGVVDHADTTAGLLSRNSNYTRVGDHVDTTAGHLAWNL